MKKNPQRDARIPGFGSVFTVAKTSATIGMIVGFKMMNADTIVNGV